MHDALAAKVIAAIAEIKRIPIESVAINSSFEQLQMDSLDAMNLLFLLEEELQVSIPDEAAHSIRDVGGAVSAVERLLAEQAESSAQQAGSAA